MNTTQEKTENIEADQVQALAKLLPDFSCDAFDYLRSFITLFQECCHKDESSNRMEIQTFASAIRSLDLVLAIAGRVAIVLNRHRSGEKIDLGIVKGIVDIFALDMYLASNLQFVILKSTTLYYTDETKKIPINSGAEVSSFLNAALEKEKNLFEKINFDSILCDEIFANVVESLVNPSLKERKVFTALVKEKKYDRLKELYHLCKITGLKLYAIHDAWKNYIGDLVRRFFSKGLDVDDLFQLKNECDYIVTECFEGHENMAKELFAAMSNYRRPVYPPPACGRGIDPRPRPITKMCASYVNRKLSLAAKNRQSKEELELWTQRVAELLPYLDMKYFMQLYMSCLLDRAVTYTTLAIDAERQMLSKIPDFEKRERDRIIEDIEAKQKSDIRWKEYLAANQICLGMELEVKRINYSWCKSITPELKYPKEFIQVMQIYDQFVDKCHNGLRHVSYKYYTPYSTCEVIGNFESGSKRLLVTVEQAAVLLLFNDYSSLSFNEMVHQTGLGESRLNEILFPIVRSGVLVTNDKDYADGGIFHYGKEFSSPLTKFNFSKFKRKKTQPTRKQEDLKFRLQTTVIRVIKRHKIMSEKELISEVRGILNTSIKVGDIKAAISLLIEKEYLIRKGPIDEYIEYIP